MEPAFKQSTHNSRALSKEDALRALMNPRHASLELFEAAAISASASGIIDAGNAAGDGAINRVVMSKRHDLIPILARHGADMNRREACGYTPLMSAAIQGGREMLEALLDGGADPCLLGASGENALLFSILGQSAECIALLLAHGACPDSASHDGATPLGNAISFGFLEGARCLLDAGASPRLPAACRGIVAQPLFLAAGIGCPDFCALLLSAGASANDRDSHGRTPLMTAAVCGNVECVRLLLPLSNAWDEDNCGKTAFDLRHQDVECLFEERRCSEARLLERQSHARTLASAAASCPPKSSL